VAEFNVLFRDLLRVNEINKDLSQLRRSASSKPVLQEFKADILTTLLVCEYEGPFSEQRSIRN